MAAKLENEYGVISIDREVIARIAGYAAIECYGIVGMAPQRHGRLACCTIWCIIETA